MVMVRSLTLCNQFIEVGALASEAKRLADLGYIYCSTSMYKHPEEITPAVILYQQNMP
ncbi:Chromosome segregation ATPase [Giardia duodenalis]|uniref:Chromosome segregation ATPase n=1 Tax=Giardia intestinalis TaxID=5741 RepID=V6U7B6_GIAIN|nr:Chromosome segregation ATPase [Giardia intestinalis]